MLHGEGDDLAEQRIGAVTEDAADRGLILGIPGAGLARAVHRELVETLRPAGLHAGEHARRKVREAGSIRMHRHFRFAALILERHGVARFEYARAVRHVDERREYDALMWHDFVKDAAHRMQASVGYLHMDQELAAGARLSLGFRIGPAVRPPPGGEMLCIGPHAEQERTRRIEHAR